jgi:Chaperone of endosialidase
MVVDIIKKETLMNNASQFNEELQTTAHLFTRLSGVLVTAITLATFALPQPAYGVSPAPDGGYPGFNTAEGTNALFSLTTGVWNTALGGQALFSDTTGGLNTAVGLNTLFRNTTGSDNTAIGFEALFVNTTGFQNTATGWRALLENTTGFHNTATGFEALLFNTTGNHNTADGDVALVRNTTGNFNTANGAHSLELNTTGSSNIALGFQAGGNLTTGSNNIDVGNAGVAAESQTIRIGTPGAQARSFIAGISGTAVTGSAVMVNSAGQLGTAPSSKRFKDEIKPMDKASEAILALKPVSFRYKEELDPNGIPQFGLIAEEVEKVDPDLVARDEQGKAYTVRYEAVNAMLLNEFLKEHSQVQQLKATVSQQQKEFQAKIAQQQKEIEALTVGLQKVSNELEVSKVAQEIVANGQ